MDRLEIYIAFYYGNRNEWSPIWSVIIRTSDLSITSMITDRIGRLEFLLPVNHNLYSFRKNQIHLGQTSLVETISKVQKSSILESFRIRVVTMVILIAEFS